MEALGRCIRHNRHSFTVLLAITVVPFGFLNHPSAMMHVINSQSMLDCIIDSWCFASTIAYGKPKWDSRKRTPLPLKSFGGIFASVTHLKLDFRRHKNQWFVLLRHLQDSPRVLM